MWVRESARARKRENLYICQSVLDVYCTDLGGIVCTIIGPGSTSVRGSSGSQARHRQTSWDDDTVISRQFSALVRTVALCIG